MTLFDENRTSDALSSTPDERGLVEERTRSDDGMEGRLALPAVGRKHSPRVRVNPGHWTHVDYTDESDETWHYSVHFDEHSAGTLTHVR